MGKGKSSGLLRVEILQSRGDKHIGGIKKQHPLGLLDDIVDRGAPVAANRTFAVLRQLFNWAIDRDPIEASPMPKGVTFAGDKARSRLIGCRNPDGVARLRFRRLANGLDCQVAALLTGARRDEIADGRWSKR